MKLSDNSKLQSDSATQGPAIEVENLTCAYGDKAILKDVSFSVKEREILFIIGGSGCGKSTLLRCMIGLLAPKSGEICYFGKSFLNASEEEQRHILKSFGVLYQSNALWSSMTIAENIALPLEQYTTHTKTEIAEKVALKLEQVGLPGVQDLYPRELSGGMKKRAALARALALDPKIVFFDEPTSGLDPVTARGMDDLILKVSKTFGTTMVIVSHELASIFSLAHRVILLDGEVQGIIAEGSPEKLAAEKHDKRVSDFFTNRIQAGRN